MKITKKQNKALDKGETNVRELFPIVFETKIEVGKWYKSTKYKKLLVKVTELEKQGSYLACYGYGFDGDGDWGVLKNGDITYCTKEYLTPATEEEVRTALINEAKKRGFVLSVIYDSLPHSFLNCDKNTKINCELGYSENENCLYSSCGVIFDNGTWAEIIKPKQMTKEQIEKELGYNIEIVE